jgi:ubiquinone/menaquinone biosynthesis C-methylase UbiE
LNDLKAYTLDHYSEKWELYTTGMVLERVENVNPVLEPMVQRIEERPEMRILDLGVGPGTLPIRILQAYGDGLPYRIYGLDISNPALIKAGQVVAELGYRTDLHLIRGDMEAIPFSDGHLDVVISNASINLICNKSNTIQEICRVLRPGGQVIIGDCFRREGHKRCATEESDLELWSDCITGAVTLPEFRGLAAEHGLTVIDELDLTDEVTSLVKSNLWDWPGFVDHDLIYFIFDMKKRD